MFITSCLHIIFIAHIATTTWRVLKGNSSGGNTGGGVCGLWLPCLSCKRLGSITSGVRRSKFTVTGRKLLLKLSGRCDVEWGLSCWLHAVDFYVSVNNSYHRNLEYNVKTISRQLIRRNLTFTPAARLSDILSSNTTTVPPLVYNVSLTNSKEECFKISS